MIRIPEVGLERSVRKHNSDLAVACDWIESWVLLCNEEISRADVRDVFLEQQYYDSQDFAEEFLADVWSELRQRMRWIGDASPMALRGDRIAPTKCVEDTIGHVFLLTISLASSFSGWHRRFGADYTEQGALFEKLVEDAAGALFQGGKSTAPVGRRTAQ